VHKSYQVFKLIVLLTMTTTTTSSYLTGSNYLNIQEQTKQRSP